ncbi:MAG TPA: phosphoglycerate dehydrogenase [Actinomycetota bacterium]|jgi:D-3-phosphoglycerate dehydrogenase|nr:phosphoglycerate dehydrogenase [Actinomycetota bacterium]
MTEVAITPRTFREVPGEHQELLRRSGLTPRFPSVDRPLDESEMEDLVRGCWGLIVGVDPVTATVMDAGALRVVVKFGSGTDNIDMEAARNRGVRVEVTAGANARSVAELTIGLLLAVARHVTFHDRVLRRGDWTRRTGMELAGRLLGVVGYGAVGSEVARLARGIGMRVMAHDPLVTEAEVPMADLSTLLGTSDAVTLHVPFQEETRGLIGPAELALMQPHALLVNTSRGGIVDERALAEALSSGRLGGAAIDTFAEEPPRGSPLLNLDNFVGSPHAGAATLEAARRTGMAAVELLLAAAREVDEPEKRPGRGAGG